MLNQDMPKTIKSFTCPSGTGKRPRFKYVYDENYGCPRRVLDGYINVQDMIQSFADDVDFKAIGKMLLSAQDNVVGSFVKDGKTVDVTGMPRNVHEYNSLITKIKGQFDALDPEIKGLFGDFDTFQRAYVNGSMKSIFETYVKSKTVKPEESEAK